MPDTSSNWRLSEQAVDRTKEHIELRFGDASSFPYMEAEKDARLAKKGMWVQGMKYVSPRDWRKVKTAN